LFERGELTFKLDHLHRILLGEVVSLLLQLLLVLLLQYGVTFEPTELLQEFILLFVEEGLYFLVFVLLGQVSLVHFSCKVLELQSQPVESAFHPFV